MTREKGQKKGEEKEQECGRRREQWGETHQVADRKKKKEQRGRRGSGVSRARRPTFAGKSRLGGRRHYEGEKRGREEKEGKVPPRSR